MKCSLHQLRAAIQLVLLLVVGLVAQSVVVAHQTRMRGLPSGFPAPVAGADVPILGVNVALEQYDDEGLEAALTRIAEGGFTWVRQSFYWSQIEPELGRFDWAVPDRILAALARHPGLRLVAVLDDSPPIPPADRSTTLTAGPDRFAAFAHEFAARYGAQVDYYQVWDEPNLAAHWGGGPVNPRAYADLLARTARAIRAADPESRILLAGLAPTVETGPRNLSDVRYLEQLYQAGATPYFDIVAGKPYGFDTGPDDRRANEAVLNFSRLLLLREVMVAHGDVGKAVWASHWGWNALPGPSAGVRPRPFGVTPQGNPQPEGSGQGWTGAPSIWGQTDETTQAAHTVEALERARAEWPWVGALILEHFQPAAPPDDPRWGFALLGQDGTPRPVYEAVAAWAAALPSTSLRAGPDAAPVGGYPAHNPWATYEGDWRVGPLGADVGRSAAPVLSGAEGLTTGSDGDRATFRFEGTSVALTVRRGPYRAFLYVTVDGRPANALPQDEAGRAYLVLYDSESTVATVPLATGLPPGEHTVEIVAEGGQGQWLLVDWRVGAEPVRDGFGWKMVGLVAAALMLSALLVRDARRVEWAALGRTFLGWPEWAQVALVVGLTGLLWAAAGASWGRNISLASRFPLPASCFFLSLLALPVLAALFALRLDLGLALVAFTAPFYLHPGNMPYRALSLPETLVLLCAIGATSLRVYQFTNLPIYQSTNLRISPIDRAVLLLVLAALVAGLAANDRWAALFELRTVFLLPALYYGLLKRARLDGRARWRIVDGWMLGAVAVAVVGLVQYALGRNVVLAEGGLPRLQSVYHSPNNVGLYLGRVWPLLVAVTLYPPPQPAPRSGGREPLPDSSPAPGGGRPSPPSLRGKGVGGLGRRHVLYGLALVPVTLALGLSFSRGALLLGVPAALLVIGWRAGGRYRWAALALLAVGMLALIPLMHVPRFASLLDLREGSTFFRLELWRSSLALIREHPWCGVGPGNFLDAYRTRYVLPTAWQEFNLEHPHNVYLDHWTRLGLLGLLAGVAVQMAFWRAVRPSPSPQPPPYPNPSASLRTRLGRGRRRPPQATGMGEGLLLGLAGSMAALLAHGLVDNTLFFPDLALVFFLTLALVQLTLS